jgi:hypothetical protein
MPILLCGAETWTWIMAYKKINGNRDEIFKGYEHEMEKKKKP